MPGMSGSGATTPMMVAEFRDWADRQPGKWELVNGRPRSMPTASFTHSLIQARAASLVNRHLDTVASLCRVAIGVAIMPPPRCSNVRAADVAITCTPPGDDGWEIVDPVFILEVLSPSNEADTRDNVWAYMTIPRVQQILLLSSTAVRGEMFERQRDGAWPEEATPLAAGDAVRITPVGFSCTLADFYARTSLAQS